VIKKLFKVLLGVFLSLVLIVVLFYIGMPVYFYLKQDPKKLYSAIDTTNKIVVTRNNVDTRIIYHSDNIFDIRSFKRSLHVEKQIEYSFPACRGELGISLYKDGQRTARIAYLQNSHIRVDDMPDVGYIAITSDDSLKKWFFDRNISVVQNQQ